MAFGAKTVRMLALAAAVVAAGAAIAACQPAAAPKTQAAPAKVDPAALAKELTEKGGTFAGVLKEAQDAGYPMFNLVFTLDGGATVEALFNNEEEALASNIEIASLVGKPVTATLKAVSEPSLLRMMQGRRLVMEREMGPDQKLVIPADAKTVTGILSGAKEPSGDLPNTLTITAKDGTKTNFREFFDENLAKADGKDVTMVYDMYNFVEVEKLAPTAAPDAAKK